MNISSKTRKMTLMAILAAIIVVLQLLTAVIKFGAVNPSLVLVPIIMTGVLVGYREAAVLGGLFGVVVYLMAAFAMDPGGYIMFCARPFITFLLCVLKGALAGLVSGLVYRFCRFSGTNAGVNTILPSLLAPLCNTGIFCLSLFLFYRETLMAWAGGTDLLTYVFTGLIGINFVVEVILDVVLCPVLATRLNRYVVQ